MSTFEEGKRLFALGDYGAAFRILLPFAEQGDSDAQAQIGLMYQLGMGVRRDVNEAIRWLTSAAKAGRGEAAHNLGTLYLTCEPDLPRDREMSRFWYQRAKELGLKLRLASGMRNRSRASHERVRERTDAAKCEQTTLIEKGARISR